MFKTHSAMFAILIGVAGCGPVVTDGPLTDPAKSEVDPALLGHWVCKKNDKVDHLFIGRHDVKGNSASLMEAVHVHWEPANQKIQASDKPYFFTISKVKNETYANLVFTTKTNDEKALTVNLSQPGSFADWWKSPERASGVLLYQLDGASLLIKLASDETIKALRKDPDITLVRGNVVTAESLLKYLDKHGSKALFASEWGPFTKVVD